MAFGIRALSRSKVYRLIAKMEVCVQSKQNVAVVDAGGSLTVFPGGQLECGEILSQHMVSFVHCTGLVKKSIPQKLLTISWPVISFSKPNFAQ